MPTTLFTQATPPDGFYTYAYIREDGRPWYVGKGVGRRAWRPHGGKRRWMPPAGEFILILKWGLTNEQALRHECYLIATLGREVDGGMLAANRSVGGESGALGVKHSLESLAEKAPVAKSLALYGVTVQEWLGKSKSERNAFAIYNAKHPSIGFHAYFDGERAPRPDSSLRFCRMKQTVAEKTAAQYGLEASVWQSLERSRQLALMAWVSRWPGKTGRDYLALTEADKRAAIANRRLQIGAQKYGVPFGAWSQLSVLARKNVGKRYSRGKRGAALLEGLL